MSPAAPQEHRVTAVSVVAVALDAMDLLGGYGSDDDRSSDPGEDPVPSGPPVQAGPATASRKKKVDFSKLPVAKSKPLALDGKAVNADGAKEEEPPLKRLALLEKQRASAGRSLLDALPAPKATLGSGASGLEGQGGGGGVRIDVSALTRPRAAPKAAVVSPELLLQREGLPDLVSEEPVDVPASALGHRMFGQASDVGGDAPSAEDLEHMRSLKSFTKISADMMQDPDWYMKNQISGGGPGLHSGKKVPEEMSMYESKSWSSTTHANPSRIQKRKHQINWLAQEAMDKEAELLDRNATSRLTKSQTQMKYGW